MMVPAKCAFRVSLPAGLTLVRCESDGGGHPGLIAADADVFARLAPVAAESRQIQGLSCAICIISHPLCGVKGMI
jgi:hypothetical protein